MKCLRCDTDAPYKDRRDGRCPKCGRRFVFEPKNGDLFTDKGFQVGIDKVSSSGEVHFGVEHLYYELSRRTKKQPSGWAFLIAIAAGFAIASLTIPPVGMIVGFIVLVVVSLLTAKPVELPRDKFESHWQKWLASEGTPPKLIVRKQTKELPPGALPPDIEAYSFDRAVICDRARTVDVLLANDFHFENNCAVLAFNGYPKPTFDVVRRMLKKNPRLEVFVLHDATVEGCGLAHRLRNEPDWFSKETRIVDVGLRPGHAKKFRKHWELRRGPTLSARPGITDEELKWLQRYQLELAVVRPEQVIKRLFRAMNAERAVAESSGGVYVDSGFSTDAAMSDGGGDSFG